VLSRLRHALAALDAHQRLAGIAAIALTVTLFLPWYQKSVAVRNAGLDSQNLSAFGVFSFIEAAVMLVALGVLALLFARGERRGFHLPGGDGTVILAAGAWAALLLLWRVFDRPDVTGVGATVGIQWGFFFAFLAAAALAVAGLRMRQAGTPEPPNPAAEQPTAVVRRDRGEPAWSSEAPTRAVRRPAPPRPERGDDAVRRPAPPRPERSDDAVRRPAPPRPERSSSDDDDDSREFRRPPEFRLPGEPRDR
jgi:hypothetical protein